MSLPTSQLSRFQVVGLHNSQTMDVHLEDNRLILVGENGTGKSTLANCIYFFLTKQWRRLTEYRFKRIEAQIGQTALTFEQEDLERHLEARQHLGAAMRIASRSQRLTKDILDRFMEISIRDIVDPDEAIPETLAEELDVPRPFVQRMFREYIKDTEGKPTHIQELETAISSLVRGQFLFLPTYRRIEQDLRSIFPGADLESDLRKFRHRLKRRTGASYLELVEFGMEDVEETITSRMGQIKENVRTGLDNLTGTYLRDVIRGVHTEVDVRSFGDFDLTALDAVFARIDDAILPTSDKNLLKDKVEAILQHQAIEEPDKVVAHFLSKLIQLYTEQQANERNVRDFVSLCNQYLSGKQLVYDNIRYRIFIEGDSARDNHGKALEMRALSSGEKQIVSLFSHLYLSGEDDFFLIIDEPELSLSVPWQRRFLPDILGTEMCNGLVAVTHSPFVWENELEPYVRPLARFTSPYMNKTL